MQHLPLPSLLALTMLVTAAAIYDCRFRRIPNWLNLCGLILGCGFNLYYFGIRGGIQAGEGLALAATVYLPLYLLRGMGAGDVKLMAAIGSLAGPANWFTIFVATSLIAGVAAAGFSLVKRKFTETCCNVYFLLMDLLQFRAPCRTNPALDIRSTVALRMPHGLLIAIGCVSALSWSILTA